MKKPLLLIFRDLNKLMLRLHYVPGNHDSSKRSAPWGFGHVSSVASRYVFLRSIKVSVKDRGCWTTGAHGIKKGPKLLQALYPKPLN